MKKIIVWMMICVLVALGAVSVSAEEVSMDPVVTEEAPVETQVPVVPSEEVVEVSAPSTVDFEAYAEQFVAYIFSGAAGSDELMDKMIEMGEQYQQAKEDGYTFKERVMQLITPENIVVTVAAAFLFVCGIAFFLFRHTQRKENRMVHSDVSTLKRKYLEEVETNLELRAHIEHQTEVIDEMKLTVQSLAEKSEVTKKDMEHVKNSSMAVATMVKDVFMNSKTIDASGKSLLIHDYTKALTEGEKFEGDGNEAQR